ncbi:hypothetical protein ACFLX4_00885 [Chloroflexota bacterium]
MLKDVLVFAFMAILVGTMMLIGTMMSPLFGDTVDSGIALARFNAGWWGILIGLISMGAIIVWAKRIDRERDKKRDDSLKELIKQAIKEYNDTKDEIK